MSESPEGCGVIAHHSLCLCDVVFDKPAEISADLAGGWAVRQMFETGDYCRPSGTELLDFLVEWTSIHDKVRNALDHWVFREGCQTEAEVAEPWRAHARLRVIAGASSPTIRKELNEMYAVNPKGNVLAMLRRRVTAYVSSQMKLAEGISR